MQLTKTKVNGIRFDLTLSEDVDKYAKDFLAIYNTARENPESFLKVVNNSHRDVYIYTTVDNAYTVKRWLLQFGEIEEYFVDLIIVKGCLDIMEEYPKDKDETAMIFQQEY